MKKVDESTRDKISDLIIGKGLTLSEFALEKDFIVTDVLHAISKINNERFDLIFCGGTCLSKAYGLLERISEDVDIKVAPKAGIALSQGQRRNAISKLKKEVVDALTGSGFSEEDIVEEARDGNSYVNYTASYSSYFEVSVVMRASMKLELNCTNLLLPSANFDIGLLFNKLAGIDEHNKLKIQCVNIQEALAEKLVSFPRRLAMHLSAPTRFEFDKALVRHLFDVNRILKFSTLEIQVSVLEPLLAAAMDKDAKDFARQYPKFLVDPVGEILNAMIVVKTDIAYRKMYEDFVAVMVYGNDVPTFDEAVSDFDKILTAILPPLQTNYLHHAPKLDRAR